MTEERDIYIDSVKALARAAVTSGNYDLVFDVIKKDCESSLVISGYGNPLRQNISRITNKDKKE